MKTTYAKTPWKICYDGQIDSSDGQFICSFRWESFNEFEKHGQDAAFIVRAVNAYDNLVAALEAMRKAARNCINTGPSPYDDNYPLELRELSDAWTIADTVLAKARGEL